MHFEEDHIYHVFNRSNETVFHDAENYLFFVNKTRKLIHPVCDILAWCLMPNHFHFLIHTSGMASNYIKEKHRPSTQVLSKNFGTLLSSYTQAVNKRHKRRGKLFSHNTKAKQITHRGNSYIINCFHYIHQNPVDAGLVKKPEDWEYSSFLDYTGLRNGTLCNAVRAGEILDLNRDNVMNRFGKKI